MTEINIINSSVTKDGLTSHGGIVYEIILDTIPTELYSNIEIVQVVIANNENVITKDDLNLGIEAALEDHVELIHISGGVPTSNTKLDSLIKLCDEENVIVVAASGNNYGGNANFPARYENVISIGSLDRNGEIANFNAKGKVDYFVKDPTQSQNEMTGTSFSAAHVTGKIIKSIVNNEISKNEVSNFLETEFK